ncbi:MAG: carboxypeptidase regulatory-like domain-containing protein, partial [Hyphomicrobiales bacterium]
MRPFNFRSAWLVVMATAALLTGGPVTVSAQEQTVGTVQGVVTDDMGVPMRGVEVVAQCSGSATCDTTYHTATGITDANGRYQISFQGIGTFYISASVMVDGIPISLTPDSAEPFIRTQNVTRNLRILYYAGRGGSDYGVGGIVRFNQPIGDYSSIAGMQVTLTPQGSGTAITRVIRETGDGLIVDGFKPGTYTVTARLNGATMMLAPHATSNWAISYVGKFINRDFNYTRHMWLDVKSAPAGTPSPTPNAPAPDTSSGPPEGGPGPEWGRPTDVPVDRRSFTLPGAAQVAGRWSVRPVSMWFAGSSHASRANTVGVALSVTNTSPLPQDLSRSFRFQMNGRSTYAPKSVDSGGFSLGRLASGESKEVWVTFSIPQQEQAAIRSMTVIAIQQPITPLLGRPSESPPIEISLYRRPPNDQVPAPSTNNQGKTDAPSGQTTPAPPPTDNQTPPPPPPGPPAPPPVPTGDVRVIGPVALSRDWSLEIVGLSHRDGAAGGQNETIVHADLINQSRAAVPMNSRMLSADLQWSGGQAPAASWEAWVNGLKQPLDEGFTLGAGQTVRLIARHPVSAEAQRAVSGWKVSVTAGGGGAFDLRLPPRNAAFQPHTPIYVGPVDPAPTPGLEAGMRALEGVYAAPDFGELTLRYEGGLLLGETRVRAGQPVMDTLKLAMPRAGKLQGVMQRTDQPPSRAWYTLDLTVSPDRARLQGEMGNVHPPINTPRAFTAQRSGPAPAPASTPAPAGDPQGQSPAPASGTGSTGAPAATTAASAAPTRVGPYDVVMVSSRKTPEGDWESTWSLTNRSSATTRVNLNDVAVTLRSADGQTSTAAGPYHYAGETDRRVRSSGFEIQPGEETKIRFWHSGSSRMTPVGYSVRAGTSESVIGGAGGGQSAAAGGAFQHTAYLDMKVDRVAPSANGGVEVTLTARHDGDIRRGIQHDPQQYAVVGSDGEEYRWDGNYYGASGTQRLSNTVYLTRSQGVVTYVFPQVPAGVTPVRLILRQNGQQTASFDLP